MSANARIDLRATILVGPARDWAAFGVQGLAPHRIELEFTAYLGEQGVATGQRSRYANG